MIAQQTKQNGRSWQDANGESDADCTVVSPLRVALLVVVCLLICLKLIPTKTEAAMRLAADGQLSRAAALIRPDEQAVNTSATLSDKEARQLFVTMLTAANPGGRDTDKLSRLMLCVNDLQWVREQITTNAPDITEENFNALMENMGDVAMARQDLQSATEAYHIVCEKSPTPQRFEKQVAAWRAKGDAKGALNALEESFKTKPEMAENPSLQSLQITLLRETSQSGRAFDLFAKTLPPKIDEVQLTMMERLAEESDRTTDVIPLQRKWLDETVGPDLATSPIKASTETIRHAFLMGRYLEWKNEPENAFAVFDQLARIGHEEAMRRCIDLYDGLNFEARMENLLGYLPAEKLCKEWLAIRAQLHSHQGHIEEALKDYSLILKNEPDNVPALGQMAAMQLASEEFAAALPLLEQAHRLDPADTKIAHALADTLISMDRPSDALPIYQELAEDLNDSDALERYELIAESLEMPDLLTDALQRQVTVTNGQAPDLQLRLADARQRLPQGKNAALATLRLALQAEPDSKPIRLELAQMLLDEGQAAEVIPLLATKDMATVPNALERLLDAGSEGAPMHLLAGYFTENKVSQSTPLSVVYHDLREALIHGHLPNMTNDDTPNEEQPDPSELMRNLAEKAYQQGQFAKALSHMKEFLSMASEPTAGDLNLLGHIYRELGDLTHSREAFQASMRIATGRSASLRNASASIR